MKKGEKYPILHHVFPLDTKIRLPRRTNEVLLNGPPEPPETKKPAWTARYRGEVTSWMRHGFDSWRNGSRMKNAWWHQAVEAAAEAACLASP